MHEDASLPGKSDGNTKLCFILGILPRSGTNHVTRLLTLHPNCTGLSPIWEDFLLHHSGVLKDYTGRIYKSWNPDWEVPEKVGPQEKLVGYFGDAICRFLRLQLEGDSVEGNDCPDDSSPANGTQILLTKTPSVVGLENFDDLFPDAHLILLCRDGRAVVESGVKSFDWNYEDAMRRWRDGARAILKYKEKCLASNRKFLLVRFEDFIKDEKAELLKVFEFLGVDSDQYDFEEASALGVIGSSETRSEAGAVHWEATKKKKEFDPVSRFKNWSKGRHCRFNKIAGADMVRLGYELEPMNGNRYLRQAKHGILDIGWLMMRTYRAGLRRTQAKLAAGREHK